MNLLYNVIGIEVKYDRSFMAQNGVDTLLDAIDVAY